MFVRMFTAVLFLASAALAAFGGDAPGVTPTEIKVGGVFPFSGPASSLGLVGKGLMAYVQMINDRGGISGRKINYIAYDDAYLPSKAVEQVRRLVEGDDVAFMFGQLGTPGNTAVAKFLAKKGVPAIAIVSGSVKFTDAAQYPLTTTGLVSYEVEGRIYAKYLDKSLPDGKYAILFQNDDLGKDYVKAFKSYFGEQFDRRVVTASYEVTEPTIESQVVGLRSSGAQALFVAGTPKFASQAIRKAAEIGWKPTIVINFPSGSVGSTLKPAGLENSTGVIVGAITKDPTDPQWENDEGVRAYRSFFEKYLPGADIGNSSYLTGYLEGLALEQILKQCGEDLSRQNIVKQAKNLRDVSFPVSMPGIKINTSETVNQLWTQLQLQRWSGSRWLQFGDVFDASPD
jgi:branched-chain amino acid transport system substrate-binding protein